MFTKEIEEITCIFVCDTNNTKYIPMKPFFRVANMNLFVYLIFKLFAKPTPTRHDNRYQSQYFL